MSNFLVILWTFVKRDTSRTHGFMIDFTMEQMSIVMQFVLEQTLQTFTTIL